MSPGTRNASKQQERLAVRFAELPVTRSLGRESERSHRSSTATEDRACTVELEISSPHGLRDRGSTKDASGAVHHTATERKRTRACGQSRRGGSSETGPLTNVQLIAEPVKGFRGGHKPSFVNPESFQWQGDDLMTPSFVCSPSLLIASKAM